MTHWEMFEKLPRPLMRWVALFASVWTLGLADVVSMHQPDSTRMIILAFIASLYGIRGYEKMRERISHAA